MKLNPPQGVDERLHDCVVSLIGATGPQRIDWLARRARQECRDARIDADAVVRVIDTSTLLVIRPSGLVVGLASVLEGAVLTHRARAPLAGRTDLWCGVSLQPLLNMAAYGPIPLRSGGEVRRMSTGQECLVGPDGWLPDVDRWELLGLRLVDGLLELFPVPADGLVSNEEAQQTRAIITHHYRLERWFSQAADEPLANPGELVRALTYARLEDPELLARPHAPLEELLYQPLERDRVDHHFREVSAWQEDTSSFYVDGLPEALRRELAGRAARYGMSFDQFVIAVLGHLAWRTPFAEDLGPWDQWDPDSVERSDGAVVAPLRPI